MTGTGVRGSLVLLGNPVMLQISVFTSNFLIGLWTKKKRFANGHDFVGESNQSIVQHNTRPKGFSLADFKIDWQQKVVRCPKGKLSRIWKPRFNRYQQSVIHIAFQKSDCQSCPNLSDCTKAKCGYRTLTLRSEEVHKTLVNARARQRTTDFKKQYAGLGWDRRNEISTEQELLDYVSVAIEAFLKLDYSILLPPVPLI